MKTPLTYNTVGQYLQEKVPEFSEKVKEHLKYYDGTILQHVLFGDFTRFIIDQFEKSKNNPEAKDVFVRSVNFIEELLRANDDYLTNLVAASFLENLHEPEDYYVYQRALSPFFGPKTLALARSMEEYEKRD